jgi:hypothetical protein
MCADAASRASARRWGIGPRWQGCGGAGVAPPAHRAATRDHDRDQAVGGCGTRALTQHRALLRDARVLPRHERWGAQWAPLRVGVVVACDRGRLGVAHARRRYGVVHTVQRRGVVLSCVALSVVDWAVAPFHPRGIWRRGAIAVIVGCGHASTDPALRASARRQGVAQLRQRWGAQRAPLVVNVLPRTIAIAAAGACGTRVPNPHRALLRDAQV